MRRTLYINGLYVKYKVKLIKVVRIIMENKDHVILS